MIFEEFSYLTIGEKSVWRKLGSSSAITFLRNMKQWLLNLLEALFLNFRKAYLCLRVLPSNARKNINQKIIPEKKIKVAPTHFKNKRFQLTIRLSDYLKRKIFISGVLFKLSNLAKFCGRGKKSQTKIYLLFGSIFVKSFEKLSPHLSKSFDNTSDEKKRGEKNYFPLRLGEYYMKKSPPFLSWYRVSY